MPRVLIVSFHYYPLEIIASERAKNMANFLPQNGWEVDVLTHDWQLINGTWDPGEKGTEKVESNTGGCRIIRLGADNKYRIKQNKLKHPFLRKIAILQNWKNGWLDYRAVCRDCFYSMKDWLNKQQSDKYNLIIGIYSPHSHLKLLSEWAEWNKVPIHFDFRDLWDNGIAGKNKKSEMPFIQQYFIKKHWNKWLNQAASLSSVSPGLTHYLSQTFHKKTYTLYTGFDPGVFPARSANADDSFKIVHAGTIYNNQKIEVLLKGIKLFLHQHPGEKIEVHFPGLLRPGETSGSHSYLANAADVVRNILDDERVFISPRIPVGQARQMMVDASVLIKPCFPDNPGIVGGKMFEYLGSGRYILSAPDDGGSIREIIENSKNGKVAKDPEEVQSALNSCLKLWSVKGSITFTENENASMQYSASEQMKKFAEWLNSNLQ